MNPTDFSVLLLAWDDADPGVAVLGGSALPPTLPLVYQLAARHPVLAVYPHLPAGESTAALEASAPFSASANAATPATTPTAADSEAAPGPLDAAADAPGVHLLPPGTPAIARPAARAGGSRLVGLDDLLPASQQQALPTSHSLTLASGAALGTLAAVRSTAAVRSQWPNHAGPRLPAAWQAPASPYAGAAEAPAARLVAPASAAVTARFTGRTRESFPPPPPVPPRRESATETAAAPSMSTAPSAAAATPDALATSAARSASASQTVISLSGTPAFAPAPDSDQAVPAPFDEPVAEMGAAEARDLDAPAADLVPDAAPAAAAPAAAAQVAAAQVAAAQVAAAQVAAAQVAAETAVPNAAPTWAVRQPTLDGLNFRMIQYARQAAQLVDGRQDFGVIYAPGWPAWLAALEVRNRSGRPLVLYAAALASDTAPTGERGWLLGLERMALRRATLVLVPDAEVLRQLHARHADALGEVRIVAADDEVAVQLVLAEVAQGSFAGQA